MKATTAFWNYFTINQKTIANLQNQPDKIYYRINFWLDRHIKNYCHHLDYILRHPKKRGQKGQVIITANGNPLYFNYVEAFVRAAPIIKDWEVKAYIQPSTEIEKMKQGLDEPYFFCDLIIKTSEIKFAPLKLNEKNQKLDIVIYLKDYKVYRGSNILLDALLIIMQDLLGEKSLYENLNFIELAQLPSEENIALLHLYDLQFYIDETFRKKEI